jgi:threonine dehydrogenase-like Zn-dependent dehydrogenase
MRTVVIVGAGALGSHLVLFARNWDVSLRVVDFDRVEAKNTAAQFHSVMGQGKNKAKAIQSAMQGLFKRPVTAFSARLSDDNSAQLLGGADLVLDCTDNYEARQSIQRYCRGESVACLHGCLSADGDLARMVWTEHFAPDHEGQAGAATCEDGQNLPFHGLAAALIAQLAQRYLADGAKQSWQLTPFALVRLA